MSTSRLRWQCRRGMRELDALLLNYLERHYDAADDEQKAAFRELLELPDPELLGYFLKRETPAARNLARVVTDILERTSS